MFTVEIRINGSLVHHIYGRNIGDTARGLTRYTYEAYRPETHRVSTGEVSHKRTDGIGTLVAKILTDAEKSTSP